METSKLKCLKVCFNSNCKQVMVQSKKGWRLRSSGFAELCDLCGSVYEEGKFCETFHSHVPGWRCCETCGKQIHCGCIVSFHMFVLLDAGGISCLTCTRNSFILTPKPAWPLPSLVIPSHPERIKDLSAKNWSPIAGSGPVPWRQAPSLFSGYKKSEQAKPSFKFDIPRCTDILHFSDKMSAFSFERQNNEDSIGRSLSSEKTWGPDMLQNRFPGKNCSTKCATVVDEICKIGDQMCNCAIIGDVIGNVVPVAGPYLQLNRNINMAIVSVPKNNSAKIFAASRSLTTSTLLAKNSSNHNGMDVSTDNQVNSEKVKGEARGRSHYLARYSPRVTDQELLQISGENHIITPLFEKTLSASDAARVGRLVLPKKCAEAYLPSISHPEGLPLEVHDAKGNQWLFLFRFWLNNNSRMYVLEGVTPCIQSLQLQAGDIVTFSRLEPEGKLIIGGRKSSATATTSTYQGNKAVITIGGMSANGMSSNECTKWSETDSMCISKPEERVDIIDVPNRTKRKRRMLASKSNSLMFDNCFMIELKLTVKEAQGLIRPPPGNGPKIIVIEGCEIEEYEHQPIIGRPSIPSSDCMGEEIQWVQCDNCLKWRKLPADTLLPSKWTCSANLWDKEKSMCSAAQELTAEHSVDLLPAISKESFKKMRVSKPDSDSVETLEALDALANLATGEKGASVQATTGHPRHKPGCSCIVCMQAHSGKGPKHKQSCDCIVCESGKHRFRTMMTKRREKQQLEKDAEMTLQKLDLDADVDLLGEVPPNDVNHDMNDTSAENEIRSSPNTARLDLNNQPERVKELALGSDFPNMFHLIHEATGIQPEHQNQLCLADGERLGGHESHQNGQMVTMFSSSTAFDSTYERIDMDRRSALVADIVAATASTSQ